VTYAKSSCIDSQRKSALNREVGVTDRQIYVYCNCLAEVIVKTITVEEVRYIARNGGQPDSLQRRTAQAAPKCTNSAFGR
jgi:hypothetical protein